MRRARQLWQPGVTANGGAALWALAMDLSGWERHGPYDGRRTGRTAIINDGMEGSKLCATLWDLEPLCLVATEPCSSSAAAAKAPGARPPRRLAPRRDRLPMVQPPWTWGARRSQLLARGRCSRLSDEDQKLLLGLKEASDGFPMMLVEAHGAES
jgi:hypothetical protein